MAYTVFHIARFSYTELERWRLLCSDGFKSFVYNTSDIFNNFCFNSESVGMSDIVRMIENKCVLLPASKKVSVTDVKLWVKAGFTPVFMRAKDFVQWKKDFENWV